MSGHKSKLVYSTDHAILKQEEPAGKAAPVSEPIAHQKIYVRLDRKGRGGKSVTLIEGLRLSPKGKEALLKQLKTRLGTGGAMKDDALEIQGDHRDTIMAFLEGLGYKPKRAVG